MVIIIIYNNIEFYNIENFPNHYISKSGELYSKPRYKTKGGLLKTYINSKGYPIIQIKKNNKLYGFAIHRLLAQLFIANPYNLLIVEHKDDNPLNFNLDNLKWSTQSNNIKKAYDSGRKKGYWVGKKHCNRKKVKQLDLDGNLIKVWDCVRDASKNLGIYNSNICNCCNKIPGFKTYKGFKWEYL